MAETTVRVGGYRPDDDGGLGQPHPSDETAALEAQIEETRRELGETIEAIQARLDPDRLRGEAEQRVEQAVDRAKEEVYDATIGRVEDATERATRTVTDWRDNVIETIRENPIPAALVGIGLGWLLMEGSSGTDRRKTRGSRHYEREYDYRTRRRFGYGGEESRSNYSGYGAQRYYNTGDDEWRDGGRSQRGSVEQTVNRAEQGARRTMRQGEEGWEDLTSGVRGRINQLREGAGELEDEARQQFGGLIDELEQMVDDAEMTARRVRYKAKRQARRARTNMQNVMEENPLALGAAALALGAAVGWAAPRTEMEDELLGGYRDQFIERAQETAERAKDQAEHIAGEATDAARDAFQNVKQEAKEAAQQVASTTKEEMGQAGERTQGLTGATGTGGSGEGRMGREGAQSYGDLRDQARRATGAMTDEIGDTARDVADEAGDAATGWNPRDNS